MNSVECKRTDALTLWYLQQLCQYHYGNYRSMETSLVVMCIKGFRVSVYMLYESTMNAHDAAKKLENNCKYAMDVTR